MSNSTRSVSAGALLAMVMAVLLTPVVAQTPARSATAEISYALAADGRCHPVSTASWSGYHVNRVRHIFHLRGSTAFPPFTTTEYPRGETRSSGTMTSQSLIAATAGQVWYVEALFRNNGGAIVAEAISADLAAPAWCLT